jgi:DNA-binding MarR family transcriptional regulator
MPRLDATRVDAWRDFQAISSALERAIDDALMSDWDLPLGWFDVLQALARLGGRARPVEIAGELRLVPSSLSRRLDRLEEEGWVARQRPARAADQRIVDVVLTARGRKLWRVANVSYRRAVQAAFAGTLSDTDIGDLQRVLAKLARNAAE